MEQLIKSKYIGDSLWPSLSKEPQIIYDIKPEPITIGGLWEAWKNNMTSKLISQSRFSVKVEVK